MSALLAALLASILAHEAGHLAGALGFNYQVLGAALGPLRIHWWNRRVILRLGTGHWSRFSVSAVPRKLEQTWRREMMTVVAAGPVVSLVFLFAATLLALRASGSPWVTEFWSSSAEVNFFLVLLGLVPNRRSTAVRNDAALFLALWREGAETRDILTCHQAIELTQMRIRPDEYPKSQLMEWAAFDTVRPYTRLMVARRILEWAIACGDLDLANVWDREALELSARCGRTLRNTALAESACLDVIFRANLVLAKRKFAKVDFGALFPPPLAERALAAQSIASGTPQGAPSHILRAQYQLPVGNPYFDHERNLLALLHLQAMAPLQKAAARG